MKKKILVVLLLCSVTAFPQSIRIDSSGGVGGGGVQAGDNTTFTGNNEFSGSNVASGLWTFGSAAGAANSCAFNATVGCLECEGTAVDANEFHLCFPNASAPRTVTFADGNGTPSIISLIETRSAVMTFSAGPIINSDIDLNIGTGGLDRLQRDTANNPDALKNGLNGNLMMWVGVADMNNDSGSGPAGTSAPAHPTGVWMSDVAATQADYSSHSYAGIAGKSVKTLTESAATSTVNISVAAEAGTAGMYLVSVYATDGATPQMRMIRITFAATNDGGVTTCGLGTPEEIDVTPTGTLTATVTCIDGTANATLQVNAVSDLTQTTLEARSQVILFGPGQILPQ